MTKVLTFCRTLWLRLRGSVRTYKLFLVELQSRFTDALLFSCKDLRETRTLGEIVERLDYF